MVEETKYLLVIWMLTNFQQKLDRSTATSKLYSELDEELLGLSSTTQQNRSPTYKKGSRKTRTVQRI